MKRTAQRYPAIVPLLAAMLIMPAMLAAGCRDSRDETPGSALAPRPLTAVAGQLTVEHLRLLPPAGGALALLGVLAAACKKTRAGLVLAIGGSGLVGLYVAASEYPWSIAGLALAVCLAGCAMAILWMLERRSRLAAADALRETVAVIQPHDELKAAMAEGDPARQEELRKTIDPIKAELRKEGRLADRHSPCARRSVTNAQTGEDAAQAV